jgi:hypothetical protein
VPRPSGAQTDLIALDLSAIEAEGAEARLIEFRRRIADDRRIVGIVHNMKSPRVRTVTSIAGRAMAVVVSDDDPVGIILRALCNDRSLTVSAAVAVEALDQVLLPVARSVARIVLGSGCEIHRVSRLLPELGCSTSSINALLADEPSGSAAGVIRLTQCAYALTLARHTSLSTSRIAALAQLGKLERFHKHCEVQLGYRAGVLAKMWPELPLSDFVVHALRAGPGAVGGGLPTVLSTVGAG